MWYIFSDGGGRSGTFLAIDANLESADDDGIYNVYGYLKKLRTSRKSLLDTLVSEHELTFKNYVW